MPGNIFSEKDRLAIRQYHPRLKPTPIPSERWNEGEQRCFSVNAKWAAHIVGLLSMLEQPDTWIGTEEECTDATEQATEIIAALGTGLCPDPCVECPECPDCEETCTGNGAGNGEEEFDDMGAYVTGAHWTEDGILVLEFGHCCSEQVRQLTDSPTSPGTKFGEEPLIYEDLDPDWEPPVGAENFACLKAWILGTTWETMAEAVIAAIGQDPISGINNIRQAVPELDLPWQQGMAIYAYAQSIERAIPSDILEFTWTAAQTKRLICQIKPRFNNDSTAMTAEEFERFFSNIESVGGSLFGHLWKGVYSNIPKSSWRKAIMAHANDVDIDCDCPEEPIIPTGPIYFAGFINDAMLLYNVESVVYGAGRQSMTVTWKKVATGSYAATRHRILIAQTSPITGFQLNVVGSGKPCPDWETSVSVFANPAKHGCPFNTDGDFATVKEWAGEAGSVWQFDAPGAALFPTTQAFTSQNEWRFVPHDAPINTLFSVTLTISNIRNVE